MNESMNFHLFLQISVAITVEYSSQKDSQSLIYNFAVFVNRCILFVYLFETILKWIGKLKNKS